MRRYIVATAVASILCAGVAQSEETRSLVPYNDPLPPPMDQDGPPLPTAGTDGKVPVLSGRRPPRELKPGEVFIPATGEIVESPRSRYNPPRENWVPTPPEDAEIEQMQEMAKAMAESCSTTMRMKETDQVLGMSEAMVRLGMEYLDELEKVTPDKAKLAGVIDAMVAARAKIERWEWELHVRAIDCDTPALRKKKVEFLRYAGEQQQKMFKMAREKKPTASTAAGERP